MGLLTNGRLKWLCRYCVIKITEILFLNIERLLSACGCCAAGIASTDPLPCGELPPQRLRGLEIGGTQKNPLAQRLGFFVWSPTALGSKRGEQPLFHGSSALKSLVVFWFSFATKREHPRRRCILQKASSLPHTTTLCAKSIFIPASFSAAVPQWASAGRRAAASAPWCMPA